MKLTAHLAAMEGNLPCIKYILCNTVNMSALLSARNDQVGIKSKESLDKTFCLFRFE